MNWAFYTWFALMVFFVSNRCHDNEKYDAIMEEFRNLKEQIAATQCTGGKQ